MKKIHHEKTVKKKSGTRKSLNLNEKKILNVFEMNQLTFLNELFRVNEAKPQGEILNDYARNLATNL